VLRSQPPTGDNAGGPNGLERVAFEIATIEGAAFGSLAKIASGGELAAARAWRSKSRSAEASPPAVLVFDEVDRGVGGAVRSGRRRAASAARAHHSGAPRYAFAGRLPRAPARTLPHHAQSANVTRVEAAFAGRARRRELLRNAVREAAVTEGSNAAGRTPSSGDEAQTQRQKTGPRLKA
jgi:DNA repair protein RecN (Recombination protein N)